MPILCCGTSSVQVDPPGTKPASKPSSDDDNENNNEGESREEETTEESAEALQASPRHTNGQLKSSSSSADRNENADPDTSAATTSKDQSSSVRTSKRGGGRKLPPRKKSAGQDAEETEGDHSSEKVSEKSTPPKKKSAKKSSFRDTEEMEMNPLDPGFYNSATLQATRQLYSQQTFEEEDEEFLESVEEERRKNKQRQRQRKKQGGTGAVPPPSTDTVQAAYERAQQEIDKVLGPRESNTEAATAAGNSEKRRSKKRSRRGQENQGFVGEGQTAQAQAQALPPSETLEEMKGRVHALLDDAFSLLSNSHTSIGNRVAPASPSKPSNEEQAAIASTEQAPTMASAPKKTNMPAVEEMPDITGLTPKPGEKLHTPVLVDRTYGDYDSQGLITWSPYRAADDTARIVLPQSQAPSSVKAPGQEKLQTTTFVGSALEGGPPPPPPSHHYHHHPNHPAPGSQPMVIRTRQPPPTSSTHLPAQGDGVATESGKVLSFSAYSRATADSDYTPYPGLEAYQDMLGTDTMTASQEEKPSSLGNSNNGPDNNNSDLTTTTPSQQTSDPPQSHTPPSRNVGTKDTRDVISASLQGSGTSAKDLVDSIRQELRSLSGKVAGTSGLSSTHSKGEGLANGGGSASRFKADNTALHRDGLKADSAIRSDGLNGNSGVHHESVKGDSAVRPDGLNSDSAAAAAVPVPSDQKRGVLNGNAKPLKKPRKSSYLDCS